MEGIFIILDGSNIAFYKRTHKKRARFHNLEIVINYLKKLKQSYPIKWEIIVDASLRHRIDNQSDLENAIKTGKIIQCPSKAEADTFILNFYTQHPENTIIISNDNFNDHINTNLRLVKYVIMFDEIILDRDIDRFIDENIKYLEEIEFYA